MMKMMMMNSRILGKTRTQNQRKKHIIILIPAEKLCSKNSSIAIHTSLLNFQEHQKMYLHTITRPLHDIYN